MPGKRIARSGDTEVAQLLPRQVKTAEFLVSKAIFLAGVYDRQFAGNEFRCSYGYFVN